MPGDSQAGQLLKYMLGAQLKQLKKSSEEWHPTESQDIFWPFCGRRYGNGDVKTLWGIL